MDDNRQDALKNLGIITRGVERFFYFVQFLSLANLLFSQRAASIADYDKKKDIEAVRKRSRAIERYIVIWLVLECAALAIIPGASKPWTTISLALVTYRIFEIFQAVININLFDPLNATSRSKNWVASVPRMVILSIWNYFEAVVCFSVVYASSAACFGKLQSCIPMDRVGAVYFSAVTQLTIGYGDLVPVGDTRIVAVIQGLLAFIIAIFAIARIVAFLPSFMSLAEGTTPGSALDSGEKSPLRDL